MFNKSRIAMNFTIQARTFLRVKRAMPINYTETTGINHDYHRQKPGHTVTLRQDIWFSKTRSMEKAEYDVRLFPIRQDGNKIAPVPGRERE